MELWHGHIKMTDGLFWYCWFCWAFRCRCLIFGRDGFVPFPKCPSVAAIYLHASIAFEVVLDIHNIDADQVCVCSARYPKRVAACIRRVSIAYNHSPAWSVGGRQCVCVPLCSVGSHTIVFVRAEKVDDTLPSDLKDRFNTGCG